MRTGERGGRGLRGNNKGALPAAQGARVKAVTAVQNKHRVEEPQI